MPHRGSLTRRALLTSLPHGVLAITVSACQWTWVDERSRIDNGARQRVAADKQALLRQYDATMRQHPDTTTRLRPLVAEHRSHLVVLGMSNTDSSKPSLAAKPAESLEIATNAPMAVPANAGAALAALATTERMAADRRLADVQIASPGLTRLLASIAGAEAAHAYLLKERLDNRIPLTKSTTASSKQPAGVPSEIDLLPTATMTKIAALQTALAAEHAAGYGYGVVGARSPKASRTTARSAYDAHRARRDELSRLIVARHSRPAAAAPSYTLPFPVRDETDARRLAIYLEEGTAASYANLVSTSEGELRAFAARALLQAAIRASEWRRASIPFPGLPKWSAQPPPVDTGGDG